MNRLQFTSYMRSQLGRTYSVADEEHGPFWALRLLVVSRKADRILTIETDDRWIRSLSPSPSREDRVLIKHLAICIQRFFANPDYLPGQTFGWPGTAQDRLDVRVALDPRKSRRVMPRT